jgi:beta-lactamase regulating signal transducer with metallopeptidase domain
MDSWDAWFTAGAWVVTYGLHSTVFLGSAWLLSRGKCIRSDATRERLWQFALLGGVISATLQTALGVDPAAGRFTFQPPFASTSETDDREAFNFWIEEIRSEACPPAVRSSESSVNGRSTPPLPAPAPRSMEPARDLSTLLKPPHMKSPPVAEKSIPWLRILTGLCFAAAALSVLRLLGHRVRLGWLLKDRSRIESGPLRERLDRLCVQAKRKRKIRLTRSGRAVVPMAMGVLKPEICLPDRAFTDLGRSEQESMLAHEMAHLVRGDPLRLYVNRILESLLAFQPLNRLGRRKWQSVVEYRCDAWAARLLGGGLSLARCLTEVADWIVAPERPCCARAMVHGMTHSRSNLSHRVRRLLENPPSFVERRGARTFGLMTLCALLIMVQGMPAFSVAIAPASETSPEPDRERSPRPEEEDADESARALIASFAALSREIDGLDREVRTLRSLVEKAGLTRDVKSFLESADRRLSSLHRKREEIKALIRRVAQPRVQDLE